MAGFFYCPKTMPVPVGRLWGLSLTFSVAPGRNSPFALHFTAGRNDRRFLLALGACDCLFGNISPPHQD